MTLSHTTRRRLGALALTGLGLLFTSACATRGAVYVRTGPPAPVVERRLEAPGPDFVWVDGHYRWNGRQYVWVAGRWDRLPRAGAVWVPGRWVHGPRGWYFVDGHWR